MSDADAPAVAPIAIPEQREFEGRPFPLCLAPVEGSSIKTAADAIAWAKANQAELDEMVKNHGAVLFRNFPIDNPEVFATLLEDGLEVKNYPYIGGAAVRTNVVRDRVFTANESPPSEPVPYHHELSQSPSPPVSLAFYCETPPASGGETPILISHRVVEKMTDRYPEFAAALEEKGVKYIRVMPSEDDPTSAIGRSWKSTFLCETKEEAEKKMDEVGQSYEWLESGDVRTVTAAVPAIRVNPRTGKKAFFNSAIAAYTGWTDSRNDPTKAVTLGDGSAVDHDAMMGIAEIMKEETVAFKWAAKDVLFIDNRAAMHSRNPFTRPRRILASIGSSTIGGGD